MTQMTRFDAIAEREKGLERGLSAGQLSMIAIGGAIGTGLFLGSSFAIGFAGPSVLVSYAIGAAIALLLMRCLAEMTIAHPTSGSFGAWAELYVSPLAGFVVRWAYWSCIVFAVGTEVTAVAIYMRFWFPGVPGSVWIAVFSALLIGINAVNVKVFGSVEYGFSALKIAAILVFIGLGGWMVATQSGFANYTARGGFFPRGFGGTWVAVIVAIFSYLSIEMIAVAAGEAENPQRAIRSAFRATVFRLIFFYLLSLAVMVAIVPWDAGSGGSPFVRVMEATHLPGAAAIMNFVILIAALSAMNSQLYASTRMMFSLSRAGFAPVAFGRLSRRETPVAALLLSASGIGVAAMLSAMAPESAYLALFAIGMFGAMFTWMMIFVTHVFFRRTRGGALSWMGVTGAVSMAAIMLTTAFTREFRMTLVCGVPFLAILGVVYWRFHGRSLSVAAGVPDSRAHHVHD